MYICSLIIYLQPTQIAAVGDLLNRLPKLERHGDLSASKQIVVIEADTEGEMLDQVNQIQAQTGVLSVNLVYQHYEADLSAANQTTSTR